MKKDLPWPGSGGADFPFRPPLGGFQKVELRGRAMWAGVRRSVFVDVCKVFNDFQTIYRFLGVSGCQFLLTYARFSMISRHFHDFGERPGVCFS